MDLVTFVSNHPFLCAAAVTLAGMIVYVEAQLITRGGNDLGLVQAIQLVNSDAVVVDVRSPERYQTGHIAGARNVPFDRLTDEADKRLGQAKDRPILAYCDNGMSGARATSLLRKLGFTKVFNLRGGLDAWRRESYPLERK